MNEKPRSLLVGLLAIAWAGAGLNYFVISRGWSAERGFVIWLAVLLPLIGALFAIYRREKKEKKYQRAPLVKGMAALIYAALAVGACIKGIRLAGDGHILALSWFLGAALVGFAGHAAFRHCLRDLRT